MNDSAFEDGEYRVVGHEAPTEEERKLFSKNEPITQKAGSEPEQITCGQGRFL